MKSYLQYITEQNQDTISDFVMFAKHQLGLRKMPKIDYLPVREGGMSTACYIPSECRIKVLMGSRATFDICRSIAHEMVHQMQDENGEDLNGDTGSPHEDEANALAGRLVRMYAGHNEGFYEE